MELFRLTYEKMDLIVQNWQLMADKYHGKFRNILCTAPAIIDPINNKVKRYELQIPYKGSLLIFTTSEKHHFKLEYRFKKRIDFNMQIHGEDFMEKISKLFGMEEIEVGNPEFDKRYIIKGSESELVKDILDSKIQEFMVKFKIYSFQMKTEKKSDLMIMPYIHEEKIDELEAFILFSTHLIERIIKINRN